MTDGRKVIAVIFGGRSVEHDVSILTGLQFLDALDQSRYRGLPVYVDLEGQWWTGEALRRRSLYPLDAGAKEALQAVTLPVGVPVRRRPVLLAPSRGLLGRRIEEISFDLMVPAIHGSHGEDGSLQGLLAFAGVPYAGCRPFGAAATMDKHATKEILHRFGLPVLPHLVVERPAAGRFPDAEALGKALVARLGADPYPVIVKPRRLGSSVAVSPASDPDALMAALLDAFRVDGAALVEPMVGDLVEYNVAVMRRDGRIVTSAIERPRRESAFLDFRTKYLAGGTAGGPKLDMVPSEGMVAQSRELNPKGLDAAQETLIRDAASRAFEIFDLAGSVRVDFLCDGKSGEIWLNEINTIPGSFAFFLWRTAAEPLGFTALASHLVEEGLALSAADRQGIDPRLAGAEIFRRD
ncbi:MAG: D-alanine--D-alanine ligase [Rhodothalassiaceae bacterium]